jgi:ribulose-5-phosphate 4-epimerase/fuculose-1-phosphate aldolase
MSITAHLQDYESATIRILRNDLALALRAASHHGLSEGVCNHFSVEIPDESGRFLLNPQGLLWHEIQGDDIVMVDTQGKRLAGRHPVESTAMFINAAVHRIAKKVCVLHTHMPYATALTLTRQRALDTALSQNAMRFQGRVAVDEHYNGFALDASEGERIATAMQGADIAFLGNHGVVVCGERIDYAYDDLYFLERACMMQVLAMSTGSPLVPVDTALAKRVGQQSIGERLQSELFFKALGRVF